MRYNGVEKTKTTSNRGTMADGREDPTCIFFHEGVNSGKQMLFLMKSLTFDLGAPRNLLQFFYQVFDLSV